MHEEVAFWANRARGEIFFFFFACVLARNCFVATINFGCEMMLREAAFFWLGPRLKICKKSNFWKNVDQIVF